MSEINTTNTFSSEMVRDLSKQMTLVEKEVFQASENKEVSEQILKFLEDLINASTKDGEITDEQWNDDVKNSLELATRSLVMDDLVDFFSVLETVLSGDLFESFFASSPVNRERYYYISRVATINLLFAPQFRKRLNKSIEMSKEWWT